MTIIYIDSDNRQSGESHDFQYQIEETQDQEYIAFSVVSCNVPKTFYILEENTTFVLKEDATEYNLSVRRGNYTLNEFINEISAVIVSAGTSLTYTVSFINRLGFLQIVATDWLAEVLSIECASVNLSRMLGIDPNTEVFFTNDTFNSTKIVQLSYDNLLLCSDIRVPTPNANNVLLNLSCQNVPFYSVVYYQATYEKLHPLVNRNNYRFYITDMDSQAVNLQGIQVNIVIKLYKRPFNERIFPIYQRIDRYINYRLLRDEREQAEALPDR